MKYVTLTVISLFIASAYAQTDKRLKGIEKELNEILKETKVAGFSVAIIEKDKIIYARGFGYSDVENNVAADENTLYAIGSCTKAFTAGLLGQLAEEDKLEFDENPRTYIPGLKFYNDEINNNVTIKDLMCHMTGIPRHDWSWYMFPTDDRDELMKRIEYHEPSTGLRQQWLYNNFMFMVQGAIAETITRKSWEQNISERFFKPLGMERSNCTISELEKASNAAVGYRIVGDSSLVKEEYYKIAAMSPAGSINSSVSEMANWVIAWINGGNYKGNQILPEWYVREAISAQAVARGNLPTPESPDIYFDNYGYAWGAYSYKGHYEVEHGGAIDGFRASTTFFPSDSVGIVVLVNSGGSPATRLVRNTIADRLLKETRTDWLGKYIEGIRDAKEAQKAAEIPNEESSDKPKTAHELSDFTGDYEHKGYGKFSIVVQNDSLFANFKQMRLHLKNKHFDVFDAYAMDTGEDDKFGPPFNFRTNVSGDISEVSINVEPAIENSIAFKKIPSAVEIDKAKLEAYTGDYVVNGITIKFYLKDAALILYVPGQREYELIPLGEHLFQFEALDNYKVEFIESDEKEINGVKLIQPNGTFVANRKQD